MRSRRRATHVEGPAGAVYTGGHPLEKGPEILTFSHFSARQARSRRVGTRSTSHFTPARSDQTSGLAQRAKHHVARRTRNSHIDFGLLFSISGLGV